MTTQQISLYYKDSGSDKVYHAQIEPKDAGFVVNFQYGRRGGNLTVGTKTAAPVSLEKAQKAFDTLVKEKSAKGYTQGEDGAIFQSRDLADRISGISPQLANSIKDGTAQKYIDSDLYCMEEKFDGWRTMIECIGGKVRSINKKGLETTIVQSVCDEVTQLGVDCLLDGELIDGNQYVVFDILMLGGHDLKALSVKERYEQLVTLKSLKGFKSSKTFMIAPMYIKDKQAAFDMLTTNQAEGVIFKLLSAPYVAGRPASGGNQLKCKFYATGTFQVDSVHKTKRSVTVCAYDGDKKVSLGSVTIYPNFDMPEVGAFVEVRYLYCFVGGNLYITSYLGGRGDQDITDCTVAQIKYKAASGDSEED